MSSRIPCRVGVDASNLGQVRTGVGNYIFPVLLRLCEQNPAVEFFLYSNDSVSFPALSNVRIRQALPKARGPIWQNIQLPTAIRKDKLDVFWGANGFVPSWLTGSVRFVLTVHDLAHRFAPESQDALVRWNRRVFQRLSAKNAHRILAVSEATARDVETYYGCKVDGVIHPTTHERYRQVGGEEAAEVMRKHDLAPGYLLSVCTLEPRKNLANLILAFQDVRAESVELPPLVLVGGRGWRDGELSRVLSKGIDDGVIRHLGFVQNEDLPALYSKCSAFIFPSIYEGFGMPVAEAQQCGAPVIFGDHSSMREAAGGIGVAAGRTRAELKQLLLALAHRECPLVCRPPFDSAAQLNSAASSIWAHLVGATQGMS